MTGANPVAQGTPLNVAAQVSPSSAAGSVEFTDNGNDLGTVSVSGGVAGITLTLTAAFLNSLDPDDPAVVERRARWLVRVITSLLVFPGTDDADEKQMLEEFVLPIVVSSAARVWFQPLSSRVSKRS